MIQTEIEENQLQLLEFKNLVDDADIIRWYRALMIVHPFKDGNGRVGGCIAAIASHYLSNGEYLLAPCQ
jgi:fido (protein-threonine AMPylation protein)